MTVDRVESTGYENLPKPPYILAPNHQSVLDWLALASVLDNTALRKTYIFAKEKHFRTLFRRWISKRINVIVMDINNDLKESIHAMGSVLKQGNCIAIFPEGTRSKDGNIGEFKKMFAILSRELSIPVVPVVIKGTMDALPSGAKFVKPCKKIRVAFLDAVRPKKGESYDALTGRIKKIIQKKYNTI